VAIKLCKTKPISKNPKMNLTNYITSSYSNNSQLSPMQKQSQTNPIFTRRSNSEGGYSVFIRGFKANPNLPATPFGGQTQFIPSGKFPKNLVFSLT
jgi:hypothetical protein